MSLRPATNSLLLLALNCGLFLSVPGCSRGKEEKPELEIVLAKEPEPVRQNPKTTPPVGNTHQGAKDKQQTPDPMLPKTKKEGMQDADGSQRVVQKLEQDDLTIIQVQEFKDQPKYMIYRPKVVEKGVKALRIGITPQEFDDIGLVLRQLGPGYRFDEISEKRMYDANYLEKFDVIFLPCAYDPGADELLGANWRKFVENGGVLYVSDHCREHLVEAFPAYFDKKKKKIEGRIQEVLAQVHPRDLQETLGAQEIRLNFDQGGWLPAVFLENQVQILLSGHFKDIAGKKHHSPLLVRFNYKKGTVIFTSFHNEKQTSAVEKKLLKYLVFTTLSAKEETKVAQFVQGKGFEVKETQRVVLSKSEASPKYRFQRAQVGEVQLGVGIDALGGNLKFTFLSPTGKKFEYADSTSFVLAIPDAEAGAWTWQVEALETPYPNFAFTVSVAEKK